MAEEPKPPPAAQLKMVAHDEVIFVDVLPSGMSVATNIVTREVVELGPEAWDMQCDGGLGSLFCVGDDDEPKVLEVVQSFARTLFEDDAGNLLVADCRSDGTLIGPLWFTFLVGRFLFVFSRPLVAGRGAVRGSLESK